MAAEEQMQALYQAWRAVIEETPGVSCGYDIEQAKFLITFPNGMRHRVDVGTALIDLKNYTPPGGL